MKNLFRKTTFSFVLLLFSLKCFSQYVDKHIAANAVPIELSNDSINLSFVQEVRNYQLIMIGEMHGTQEPPKFVDFLIQQLVNNGVKICLGLEIPENDIGVFIDNPTKENLKNSPFFKSSYMDGRANKEWFSLILRYTSHSSVKLFYYDEEQGTDSLMYLKVKQQMVANPNSIVITIGGNIHNRLLPFKNQKTMACYFNDDLKMNISKKICTINHQFKSGTMRNSMGSGLKLNIVEPVTNIYTESTPYDSYFYKLPDSKNNLYNAIFYTVKITASDSID